MKRIIISVIGVLVVAFAATALLLRGRRYDVTITQSQIDEALQARFPVSKTHLLIFQITYSNPKVCLLAGVNRVEVALDAELNVRLGEEPKRLGGSAIVTTGVSYRSETHQFFLSDPDVTSLTLQGIPQKHLDTATQFASSVAREHLERYPIYTLKATDAKTTAAKLLLKEVEVKNSEIHVRLGL